MGCVQNMAAEIHQLLAVNLVEYFLWGTDLEAQLLWASRSEDDRSWGQIGFKRLESFLAKEARTRP